MQQLNNELLKPDATHGGFEQIPADFFCIRVPQVEPACISSYSETYFSSREGHSSRERLRSFLADADNVSQADNAGTLLCMLHRFRPAHVSGEADKLPFADPQSANHLFAHLDLPTSYLQLADGSLSLVHSSISRGAQGPNGFEFTAYGVTKEGDWSMALRHRQASKRTSVFWSLDQRMPSSQLVEQMWGLQDHACHPLLLPCIMFEAVLQAGLERRHTIKAHLRILEHEVQRANRTAASATERTSRRDDENDLAASSSRDLEHLFERLQSCRSAQESREGRYELWRSFHEAVARGFTYCEDILAKAPENGKFATAHGALRQFFELTWTKFESLKARDKDHVERINNLSDVLYNIVHLRDSRVQLDIALAAKRDSEDMKFITLLGAVFLPASLIASILNVHEFQFLTGGKLFGVYVAITIPLAGLLVTLFLARPLWRRWYHSWWRLKKAAAEVEKPHDTGTSPERSPRSA